MKAKLIKQASNAKNQAGDKELVSAFSVIGKIDGALKEVVCTRVYMGRSKSAIAVHASIWVHGTVETSGRGSATGYGYHKESAAIASAIESAGIELLGSQYSDDKGMVYVDKPNPNFSESALNAAYAESEESGRAYSWHNPRSIRTLEKEDTKKRAYIGGCGDEAVRVALLAIARMAGAKGQLLIVTH